MSDALAAAVHALARRRRLAAREHATRRSRRRKNRHQPAGHRPRAPELAPQARPRRRGAVRLAPRAGDSGGAGGAAGPGDSSRAAEFLPAGAPPPLSSATAAQGNAPPMADETVLNLFVSSPGDVQSERERVDFVVERLNAEFAGRARIRTIRWETRYYSSHETFQTQIPEAAACDLVVAIFGARLGSPLPAHFPPMPTGEPYPSGTAYEVLSAIEARRKGQGVPDIYVFRRPRAPLVALDARDRAEIEAQWRRLTEFFETWFRNRCRRIPRRVPGILDHRRIRRQGRGLPAPMAGAARLRRQGRDLGPRAPGLAVSRPRRLRRKPPAACSSAAASSIDQAIRRLREVEAPAGDAAPRAVPAADRRERHRASRRCCAPGCAAPRPARRVSRGRPLAPRDRRSPAPTRSPRSPKACSTPEALGPELRARAVPRQGIARQAIGGRPRRRARAAARRARQRGGGAPGASANFEAPRPARLLLGDRPGRAAADRDASRRSRRASARCSSALARHRLATVVMALRSDAYARFQAIDAAGRAARRRRDARSPAADAERARGNDDAARRAVRSAARVRAAGRPLARRAAGRRRARRRRPAAAADDARRASARRKRRAATACCASPIISGLDEAVTETANEALAGLDAPARAELPDLIAGLVRDVAADPADRRADAGDRRARSRAFRGGPARAQGADRGLRRQAPADRRGRRREPARAPDP